MKLFIVRREAVYIHETVGIFDDLDKAEKVARLCAAYDYDGHHEYIVYSTNLNEATVKNVSTEGWCANPVVEMLEQECSFWKEVA